MAALRPLTNNKDYYTKAFNYYISQSNNLDVIKKWTEGPFCYYVRKQLVENVANFTQEEPVHVLGVGSGEGKAFCFPLFVLYLFLLASLITSKTSI